MTVPPVARREALHDAPRRGTSAKPRANVPPMSRPPERTQIRRRTTSTVPADASRLATRRGTGTVSVEPFHELHREYDGDGNRNERETRHAA